MIDIKLYGAHTAGYSFVKKSISEFLNFHHIKHCISEIDNIELLLKDNIDSVPTVIINDDAPVAIKEIGNLQIALKKIFKQIVEHSEIKELRKILCYFDYSKESFIIVDLIRKSHGSQHYILSLFDIKNFNGSIIKSGFQKIEKITENLEQTFIGDLSCNLFIQPAHLEFNNNEKFINFDDFELIFIPITAGFDHKSLDLDRKIKNTHSLLIYNIDEPKYLKYVHNELKDIVNSI